MNCEACKVEIYHSVSDDCDICDDCSERREWARHLASQRGDEQ